jgi:hypothetical protein
MVLSTTLNPSFSSSPRMRSLPPARVLFCDASDPPHDVVGQQGSGASSLWPRLSSPQPTEQLPVPAQHSLGLHDHKHLLPGSKLAGQQDEQHPVMSSECRALHLTFQHNELLPNPILMSHPGIDARITHWLAWARRVNGLLHNSATNRSPNPWTMANVTDQDNGDGLLFPPPRQDGSNLDHCGQNGHRGGVGAPQFRGDHRLARSSGRAGHPGTRSWDLRGCLGLVLSLQCALDARSVNGLGAPRAGTAASRAPQTGAALPSPS